VNNSLEKTTLLRAAARDGMASLFKIDDTGGLSLAARPALKTAGNHRQASACAMFCFSMLELPKDLWVLVPKARMMLLAVRSTHKEASRKPVR
jgi:hypothetical protein